MADSTTTHTAWRKSSHSGNGGGQCVEIATMGMMRLARDSKHPEGAMLTFTPQAWAEFLNHIKAGHLGTR